ncbi:MAG: ferric iron uptake transcriptional regulator, partial [Xanthomonadales bacterium]|nr:ferric iron uptake transcriptional regulator [Xanthomonadales bacterium]
ISEDIERLQREIAEKFGYDIEDHSLVIYVRPKRK